MQNLASFIEYTDKPYTHTFMRMQLDNGMIEEVDMVIDAKGKKYRTRLDDSKESVEKVLLIKEKCVWN